MVLRKAPPPGIVVPPRGTDHPHPRSATTPTSNSSQSSPNRLVRPRRARTVSTSPRQVSVYSPDLNTSPAFDLMSLEEAQQKSPMGSSFNDPQNPWAEELVERPDPNHLPPNLQTGPVSQPQEDTREESKAGISRIPPILMEGTARRQAAEELPRNQGNKDSSTEAQPETGKQRLLSNNPFLRARNPSTNPWDQHNGSHPGQPQGAPEQNAWATNDDPFGERISQSSGFIPMTARLSLLDQPEDPWAQQNSQSAHTPETSTQHQPVSSNNASTMWSASSFDGTATSSTYWVDGSTQSAQERTSNDHDQGNGVQGFDTATSGNPFQSSRPAEQPAINSLGSGDVANGSNGAASNLTPASSQDLLDFNDPPSTSNKAEPVEQKAPEQPGQNEKHEHTSVPTECPRSDNQPSSAEQASEPRQPPPTTTPLSEAEMRKQLEKQAETYAIRHINWTDHSGQLRESPVLVQNKNGPCPLLALVNGLVMRSEKDAQPPIVKALQTREQISLGLLIQALFDELTTYHDADEELPDIEALSRFLTMLHTGMNVNPRLTLESENAVGSFLETNDLRLYGTFKVPLVHGWVASPSSEAHAALSRVAQYHEDIQLLQFRKEELEDRVIRGGSLSAEEEQLVRDIDTIQYFVNVENATQLSAFGLNHLAQTLAPGSISILFRNDHFSTLYKHPQSHQLFTLITDAGYADHAEIVWESLVDVNGSNAGFFAGDFRPVGHAPAASTNPAGQRSSSNAIANHTNNISTQHTEQTDADYAYALSLQFQEEAQRENARNRRASTPYYGSTPRPAAHNRSSSSTVGGGGRGRYRGSLQDPNLQRPSIPPRNVRNIAPAMGTPVDPHDVVDDDDDAPPPSYEQVARNKAYEAQSQRGRRSSYEDITNYSLTSGAEYGRSPRPQQQPPYCGGGRRQPGLVASSSQQQQRKEKGKDCVVM
ncbi:hypothetical protein VTN96DRAFT_9212 [Rasamsonia emersonii]